MKSVYILVAVLLLTSASAHAQDDLTWNETTQIRLNNTTIQDIAWNTEGTQLAVATWSEVIVFEMNTGQRIASLQLRAQFSDLSWRPGTTLLSFIVSRCIGGQDYKCRNTYQGVIFWDFETGMMIERPDPTILALAWTNDGRQLINSHNDGTIRAWNTGAWKAAPVIDFGPRRRIDVFSLHPDGSLIALGSNSFERMYPLEIYDLNTAQLINKLYGYYFSEWMRRAAWNPNGDIIVGVGTDLAYRGLLNVWDARTGDLLASMASSYRLAWSLDGCFLAADIVPSDFGIGDTTAIRIRDFRNQVGKIVQTLSGRGSAITALAWTRDDVLAAGYKDGSLRIWRLHNSDTLPQTCANRHRIIPASGYISLGYQTDLRYETIDTGQG